MVASIYKMIDTDGSITYTDSPNPEKLVEVLPEKYVPSFQLSPVTNTASTPSSPAPEKAKEIPKYSLEFIKPEQHENFPAAVSSIDVTILITPTLRNTDKVILILDGKEVNDPENKLNFTLPWLPRGEHTLKARIISDDNTELLESDVLTFYQRRTSIIFPDDKRPRGPGF